MSRARITKSSFTYDKDGRAILGSAKDMAAWVKLGFEEQDKRRMPEDPFRQNIIDLRNCVLYVSYPIGSKTPASQIFNLCDLAGVVPGIEKIEGDPDFLFEVKRGIRFDGSILYGNFFHYVKFDGMVSMDGVTVLGLCSCFKCHFEEYAYMQRIHLEGGVTFEQCEFSKGLIMSGAEVGGISAQFNNSIFKADLRLASVSFANSRLKNHMQVIEFSGSSIENLNISKVRTDEIPVFFKNTSIKGMRMDNVKIEGPLDFESCVLDGIVTSVKDEGGENNFIKELSLHCCDIKSQYHIESGNIKKFVFSFGKIDGSGRLRFSQCKIEEFLFGSSSVFGQLDIIENNINALDMEGTCVMGNLLFQGNKVVNYSDRQTVRLLKNEAIKVNDEVSAVHLYAKEMRLLLADKSISRNDKVSLMLNKVFSSFGEKWFRAIWVTLLLSVVLTILMLGFGSSKYMFDPTGELIGFSSFVTILLDSINVFSIPLFSDTIREYQLNVFGQILYFLIKLVVAYGSYQFVVAFRKYGKR